MSSILTKYARTQELFEDLILYDDFDLEGMDTFSNILYMKEDFAGLSHLAHKAVLIDKYRPETCCIIGNYYSLKAQHDKVCLMRSRFIPPCLRVQAFFLPLCRRARCSFPSPAAVPSEEAV
jgi:hypothetical protein